MRRTATSLAAVAVVAGAFAIGNIVPPVITVTDFSKAFFAPGEFHELVVPPFGTLEGSFIKTYHNELYEAEYTIVHYPTQHLQLWPHPTHHIEVHDPADSTRVDYWWARFPEMVPGVADTFDWRMFDAAADSFTWSGDWLLGPGCFVINAR